MFSLIMAFSLYPNLCEKGKWHTIEDFSPLFGVPLTMIMVLATLFRLALTNPSWIPC